MTKVLYTLGKQGLLSDVIELSTDDLIFYAVTSGYVFNAGHEFASSLGANVIDVTATLTGKSFSGDTFSASNPSIPFVTTLQTVDALVLAQDNGSAATNRLILYTDESPDLPWVGTGAPVVISLGGSVFSLADC